MSRKKNFITAIFNSFIASPKPFSLVGKGGHPIAVKRSHEEQHRYQLVVVLTDLSPTPKSPQYIYGEDDRERFIRWVNRHTYLNEVRQCADDLTPKSKTQQIP